MAENPKPQTPPQGQQKPPPPPKPVPPKTVEYTRGDWHGGRTETKNKG
jgi:hypothetical protein